MLIRSLVLVLALPALAVAQNDECSGAVTLSPGTFPFDTTSATLSAPAWSCGGGGGPDVWYRYVASTNAPLQVNLCGSGYDTVLEAFRGDCGNLTLVACDDDGCVLQSAFIVPALSGQEYFIRVGGFQGATGSGILTFSLGPITAGGDDCEDAELVLPGSTPFHNLAASDSPQPWSCGPGARDMWFEYQGTGGTVDVNLCVSSFDTVLEVLTGDCANLTVVACNDDSCGEQSRVDFVSSPGQTYFIRVGGKQGALGNGTLQVIDPGPPAIGSSYCTAVPNSTGVIGVISGAGSTTAANNNLTLTASSLPNDEFAVFIASQTQAFLIQPGGSLGNLCMAGNIARFTNQVVVTSGGQASIVVDLTNVPEPPALSTSVSAGQTWYFQCWHRDMVGGVGASNFSDALEIGFN